MEGEQDAGLPGGLLKLENLFAPEGHPGREPWIANAVAVELVRAAFNDNGSLQ